MVLNKPPIHIGSSWLCLLFNKQSMLAQYNQDQHLWKFYFTVWNAQISKDQIRNWPSEPHQRTQLKPDPPSTSPRTLGLLPSINCPQTHNKRSVLYNKEARTVLIYIYNMHVNTIIPNRAAGIAIMLQWLSLRTGICCYH